MSNPFHSRLKEALNERIEQNRLRELALTDDNVLNLANNDYCRLAESAELKAAAIDAIERYGCSASASPLLSGYKKPHEDLLEKLKDWYGMPHGLLWNTGYAANQAVLSCLPKNGDIVIADRLIHNSMITGIKRSAARHVRYKHCDLDALEAKLVEYSDKTIFVVTESLFSMDGDYPDLKRIAELKSKYGFIWILDEAHAIGWYGKTGSGLAEEFNVREHVDVLVGTLGKAMGSMGAFTLFQNECLPKFLINHAGEFIYSTYPAPSTTFACSQSSAIQAASTNKSSAPTITSVTPSNASTLA